MLVFKLRQSKLHQIMHALPPLSLKGLKPVTTYYCRMVAIEQTGNVSVAATSRPKPTALDAKIAKPHARVNNYDKGKT